MKQVKMLIQIFLALKQKIDKERQRGTTAAGLIRHLLERYFNGKKAA